MTDTTTTITTTAASTVAIRTVHVAPVAPMICVRADFRDSTKDGKKIVVPKENRHRSIHVQGWELPGVPDKFCTIIQDALMRAAEEQFKQFLAADGGMMRTELDPLAYTVDSLLAFAALETQRTRFTSATIATWFADSALARWIKENKGADAARLTKVYSDLLTECYNAKSTKAIGLKNIDNCIAAMGKAPEDLAESATAQTVMEKLLAAQAELQAEMAAENAL